jgi:hypothetical protein
MVDDRAEWDMCEEREGGRGVCQIACMRSCVEVDRGKVEAKKAFFAPEMR